MKKNVLIGLMLIGIYSCSEDSETDRREQYTGDYHFTVKECIYGWVETDTGTIIRYDTSNYEFDGNILVHDKNYLQILNLLNCNNFN